MIEPEGYCREIEAYLCRKNDGHLVRISGPAFEQVSRWAQQGIPLTVACHGIDRYFERYYRRGPRRRPVRVEFCEADVLDAFDDWRRAVGVSVPAGSVRVLAPETSDDGADDPGAIDATTGGRRRISLSSHIERAIARLTSLRASSQLLHRLQDILEHIARELDALQPEARRARGEARSALLVQLSALDRTLLAAVIEALDDEVRQAAEAEAKSALGPFRDRMAPDAYQRACVAAFEKQVREQFGLPVIAFD